MITVTIRDKQDKRSKVLYRLVVESNGDEHQAEFEDGAGNQLGVVQFQAPAEMGELNLVQQALAARAQNWKQEVLNQLTRPASPRDELIQIMTQETA